MGKISDFEPLSPSEGGEFFIKWYEDSVRVTIQDVVDYVVEKALEKIERQQKEEKNENK